MSFQNPWGLLALLLVVPLILLYMLKQEYKDIRVSTTFLWQEVERQLRAAKPWQRLKTRLLLVLQILAIIIFALALARPVYRSTDAGYHYVAVVDSSARMQATDIRPSRMEAAKKGLKDLIATMTARDRMTIIQAGIEPFVVVDETGDKGLLRQGVDGLEAYNSRADIEKAIQLAEAIIDKGENGQLHLFTDSNKPYEGVLQYHIYKGDGNNLAISNVSTSPGEEGLVVLSRVRNYGDPASVTLELRVDGSVFDIKEVSLAEGGQADIYWTRVPREGRTFELAILNEDDLAIDNRGWAVNKYQDQYRALLVTDRNVFIERAVGLRKDIELVKTTKGQDLVSQDFSLYIYDGYLPERLPKGHMIVFNPPENGPLDLVEEGQFEPVAVRINRDIVNDEIISYIEATDFQIAKAKKLKLPQDFDIVLEDQKGNPLLILGDTDQGRLVIFAFSLKDSNLPLKADFPILMQALLNWTLPPGLDELDFTYPGDPVLLAPMLEADQISVISPSGKEYNFDPYPVPYFYDSYETGIYQVVQRASDKLYRTYFPVVFQTSQLSDLRDAFEEMPDQGQQTPGLSAQFLKDFWKYAGWALVLLLLIEWWVYHYGS